MIYLAQNTMLSAYNYLNDALSDKTPMRFITILTIEGNLFYFLRKGLCLLFIAFSILSASGCSESDEELAERNRRLDIWFESLLEATFKRDSMGHFLNEVESLGTAYLGKTEVRYPDNSGAYLVYGLQNVNTENRGNGYIFLFCTINIGDLSDECSSNRKTFLSAENYSVEAIRELVRKSNAMGFSKLEFLGGFGPSQRNSIVDIDYEPTFN